LTTPSHPHSQGAVPSENINHPYTGELKRRLQQNLGEKVEVTNGGEQPGTGKPDGDCRGRFFRRLHLCCRPVHS
jgi:hypothetical protein